MMWSQVVGEVGEVSASVVVVVKKLLKNQCMKSLIVFVRGRCTPSYSYSQYIPPALLESGSKLILGPN